MSESTPFLRNLSLNQEEAYELAYSLEGMQVEDVNGCSVFSGLHPEYGNIHVIIPAIGDQAKALLPFELLPVVLHAF